MGAFVFLRRCTLFACLPAQGSSFFSDLFFHSYASPACDQRALLVQSRGEQLMQSCCVFPQPSSSAPLPDRCNLFPGRKKLGAGGQEGLRARAPTQHTAIPASSSSWSLPAAPQAAQNLFYVFYRCFGSGGSTGSARNRPATKPHDGGHGSCKEMHSKFAPTPAKQATYRVQEKRTTVDVQYVIAVRISQEHYPHMHTYRR